MQVSEFKNHEIAFFDYKRELMPFRGYQISDSKNLRTLLKLIDINEKKYNSYVTIAKYSSIPRFPLNPKKHWPEFKEWVKIRDETIISMDFMLDFDAEPTIDGLSKAWEDVQLALTLLPELIGEQSKYLTTYFSVVGNTKILIKNKGTIELITFEELFKKKNQFDNPEILSFDSNKVKFSKITNYIKHDKQTIDIFYENCYSPVTMSPDHSVFVFDNNTGYITTKQTKDVNINDFLPTFITNNTNTRLEEINFSYKLNGNTQKHNTKLTNDLLRLCGYYLGDGHLAGTTTIGFSFGTHEKVTFIKDVDNIVKTLSCENYYFTSYSKVSALKKEGLSRKQIINKLSYELSESQCCNRLYSKHNLSLKKYEKVSHRLSPQGTCTQLIFCSKKWHDFLEQNFNKGAHNKKLPSWVWKLNKEQFLELLQGYINSDGYKKDKSFMCIKSVSKQLIEQFAWLCKLNGIGASIRKEIGKPHTLPQGNLFKGSITYNLYIVWQELNNNPNPKFGREISQRLLPTKPLKKMYSELIKIKINHGMRQVKKHRFESSMLKKKRVNKKTILKIINWFELWGKDLFNENQKEIINNYKLLINSDIGFVKITNIKNNKIQKVYDVSVANAENFWGGDMPILLHNSGNKGFHILGKCKINTTAQDVIDKQLKIAQQLEPLCKTLDITIYDTARLRKLLGSIVYSDTFGKTRVIPISNQQEFKELIQALKQQNFKYFKNKELIRLNNIILKDKGDLNT
jgi:hypothetical protein